MMAPCMGEHDRDPAGDGRASQCHECGSVYEGEVNFCPDCGAAIEDALAAYCRVCGDAFDPEDRFCSDCGAARNPGVEGADVSGTGSADSGATATDESPATTGPAATDEPPAGGDSGATGSDTGEELADFRRRVRSYLASGWEIEHDYGDSVVLVDRGLGNIPAHLLLFIFTGGIGNALYAFYSYNNGAERIELSADDVSDGTVSPGSIESPGAKTADGSESTSTSRVVLGALLALGGLAMLASGPLEVFSWVFGLPILLGGLYLFPPTRRRIERRHPVTRFGTVRSTDETVVHSPDKPCVACGRPIDTGIRRSYREETVVAGIPILTSQEGENHYCETCSALGAYPDAGDPTVDPVASTDPVEQGESTDPLESGESTDPVEGETN